MPVAFSNGDGTFRVTNPVATPAKPSSDLSVVVPPEAAPVVNQPGTWVPVPTSVAPHRETRPDDYLADALGSEVGVGASDAVADVDGGLPCQLHGS
jgi:hypothetical protein